MSFLQFIGPSPSRIADRRAVSTRGPGCKVLLATLACALLAPLSASAQSAYTERHPLIPRTGQGLGTVSAYAGVAPVLAPNDAGHDVITLPGSDKREINLVWTFWRHRLIPDEQWPVGPRARTIFTLRSAADTTLALRVAVRSGEWTDLLPGPELKLQAGRPMLVEVPLPAAVAPGAIENLRINFTSAAPIPELTVMEWSVGESAPAPLFGDPAFLHADDSITGTYHPARSLIPPTGDGTVSDYAGTSPVIAKDARGNDVLQIPAPGGNMANLVWTYWQHKRPDPDQWPAGPKARTSITLRADADTTLHTRLTVRTSDWSKPTAGPTIKLRANESQAFQLPLPADRPPGPVQNLRVILTAEQDVPPLTVLYWSVGSEN